jgi:predicted mannosyl-3-phosphoglycerate phosphatase (HAD superfamily)
VGKILINNIKKMSKLTEAQMLREYIEILKAREAVFIKQFREMLNESDLTINEAKPFYELLNSFEDEQ